MQQERYMHLLMKMKQEGSLIHMTSMVSDLIHGKEILRLFLVIIAKHGKDKQK